MEGSFNYLVILNFSDLQMSPACSAIQSVYFHVQLFRWRVCV